LTPIYVVFGYIYKKNGKFMKMNFPKSGHLWWSQRVSNPRPPAREAGSPPLYKRLCLAIYNHREFSLTPILTPKSIANSKKWHIL